VIEQVVPEHAAGTHAERAPAGTPVTVSVTWDPAANRADVWQDVPLQLIPGGLDVMAADEVPAPIARKLTVSRYEHWPVRLHTWPEGHT
jgi:hypothetical protein